MNKENIKIGLLGLIALTLVVNTYFAAKGKKSYSTATPGQTEETSESSKASSTLPAAGNSSTPAIAPATIDNTGSVPNAAANNGKATSVSFAKYEHDYGNVVQESANKTAFVFTNTGKEPLIISSATGSCGCTVPNYPKEPIMPGKTGKIDVEFKPSKGQTGNQEKTVTVTANTEPAQTILKIKAMVK